MFGGEALVGPGMKDAGLGEPVVGDPRDLLPCRFVLLAAAPERPPPQVDDMVSEGTQGLTVGWDRMVGVVADDDLLQPLPLDGERLMHALSQPVLHFCQFHPHAVATGLPFDEEAATAACAADEGEAEEGESVRCS